MKQNPFADKKFHSKLIHLTLPAAFQCLMLATVAAADAFMLGGLNQDFMSSVSLATQIQFVQNLILMSSTGAAALLGAQYWGKGDKKSIEQIFGITLKICGFVSLLFFLACEFFPELLMSVFTDVPKLVEIGVTYLRLAGWSYLFTGISQSYEAVMKVTDHVSTAALISGLAVVINIVLNAVLIFGLFGLPEMGVSGAAIATLVSRITELILCVAVSARETYLKPKLRFAGKDLLKDYIKSFIPLLGAYLFWGVGFTSYSAFMGHLGNDAAAANSVTAVIRDLVCCLCDGLAVGGKIVVGNELGAGNLEKGKNYGNRLASLSFLCGFGSTIIMLVLTPVLLMFVKLTPNAKTLFLQMMIIMAFYMIGRCVNTIIINGVFTAGGDTMFDFYSLAVTMWCIAVPLAFVGTFWLNWPIWVVYACTCVDEVGKIPWVIYHFKKYKWVKNITRD